MTPPGWTQIPLVADERPMLLAFLTFYRHSLLHRADGLSHDQMQQPLTDSGLTISRLLGHMAFVEHHWFAMCLDGEGPHPLFADLDWEADNDAEMTLAQSWSIDELHEVYHAAIADSDRRIEASESLDRLTEKTNGDGEHWNLRWLMIHMIEEYARHAGHADLIRESIDGNRAG